MSAPKPPAPAPDFAQVWMESRATPERVAELAGQLGVTPAALEGIGVGWIEGPDLDALHAGFGGDGPRPTGCSCFPEYGEDASVVCLSLRAPDGRKGSPRGGKRGVVVPETLEHAPAPCLVVEGASDVAACLTLGLAAVGRPSNNSGADIVHGLVPTREILVVGEYDRKPDGSWPGRNGANAVASRLAELRGEPVSWTLPPDGAKDIRAWLNARVAAGLNSADPIACREAGFALLAELKSRAESVEPAGKADEGDEDEPKDKRSQADKLVDLAAELYRLGRDETDGAFAVRIGGPNVAVPFAGGRDALRRRLAKAFRAATRKTPSASALADALLALGGMADDAPREAVHLRVARHEGKIVIDLGDETGRAVVVSPDGWEVVERSPVLFRRTALTMPLPVPTRGGDLDDLMTLLNVAESDRAILRAWLVAAIIPDIAHAILLLTGLQGAGKSTAQRMLATLIDPSASPLRSPPRDIEAWAITAAASWVVPVDNVSAVPLWWSDALCRAVSGDGWLRRKLYTDSETSVLSFRRVVLLSSIDAGALRGDLTDRLLTVELDPIPDGRRRSERDILAAFEAARPALLGAQLDAVVVILRRLPHVHLDQLPRLADFGLILAALDEELGTSGLNTYLAQRDTLARDVLEGDQVGQAVVTVVTGRWVGTSTALLNRIKPERPGPEWPCNGRAMSGRLRRLIPALTRLGLRITPPDAHRQGGTGQRLWSIERVGDLPSRPPHCHGNPPDAAENADSGRDGPCDGRAELDLDRHTDRHGGNPVGATENATCDGRDGCDGRQPLSSVGNEGEASVTLEFEQPVPEPGAAETGGTSGDDVPEGWSREAWSAICEADAAGLPGFTQSELNNVRRASAAARRPRDIPGGEAF